jgi:hypothetical protein
VLTSLNSKATTAQLSDYYTKTSIDTKLSKQVNYLYDIDSKLNTIAINKIEALDRLTSLTPPLIDIQSNTRIIGTLNVTNDLTVDNINVLNSLDDKTPKASPTFTGTLTCVDAATIGGTLTVSGARLYVAQNITNTQLNGYNSLYFNNTSGASVSEVGRIFCGNSVGLNLCTHTTHPIKFTTYANDVSGAPVSMEILGTGTRDVEISAPLKIKCLQTTIEQAVVIGGAAPAEATGLYVSNNAIINKDLTVAGNLIVEGFISARPYASLRVSTGITAGITTISTGTIAATIGTPGPVSLTQYGFVTNVGVSRGTVGTTNLFLYSFTLPTAHPQGLNYIVNGGFQTGGSTSPSPNAFLTFNVTSSTTFNVWVRSPTGILMDGNFYVYTVP